MSDLYVSITRMEIAGRQGAIMVNCKVVHGLTTAAGIWGAAAQEVVL